MANLTINFVNKNEGDSVKATVKGGFYNISSTYTTTNNALTFIVLDGNYTLTVEGDGYEDYIQSVSVVGDTTIEVTLVPLGAGNYPYVPVDNLYLGNMQVQKLYLGVSLLWELESEPSVPEATFTLFARHGSKSENLPYVPIRKDDFANFGVDPSTVTAITANGRRYDVTWVEILILNVYFHIENASDLELNGFETLTIHYRE